MTEPDSEFSISLPFEIERLILELSARVNPGIAPILVRISTYVSQWIIPILYDTVIVGVGDHEPATCSIQKYGHHVHHLLIGQDTTVVDIASSIISCPNLTNLGIWSTLALNGTAMEAFKRLPLTRLSISFESLFDLRYDEPIPPEVGQLFSCFTQLTHLDVVNTYVSSLSDCIRHLPSLTYLSLSDGTHEYLEESAEFWEALPQLRVVVVTEENTHYDEYSGEIQDDTLLPEHAIVTCEVPDYLEDWKRGARGEAELWECVINLVDSVLQKTN